MINSVFFAPCGWYASFHIGAWRALLETNFLTNIKSLGGGSSGSLIALSLSADIDYKTFYNKLIDYSLMYPGILCWGKMSNIVGGEILNLFNDDKSWKYEPYVVITNFQKSLPFIGPRFITNISRENKDEIKNLILSSCYIPIMYEKIPKWDNKFVIDGGCFLMSLTIPNTLTISPYMEMSSNVIGYEIDSDDSKILNDNILGSLLPNKDCLTKIEQIGYNCAKNWIEKFYNKKYP